MVKFQENVEKKLSEQELQFIGFPKINNFGSVTFHLCGV
jgi:hypothetical protein